MRKMTATRNVAKTESSWEFLVFGFPFYSASLFKMSGGQPCSNLALLSSLHKCFCRPARRAVLWRGGETGPF